MSNYPPGVTGNEPEIAGYAEGTERVESCECMIDAERIHFAIDWPTRRDLLRVVPGRNAIDVVTQIDEGMHALTVTGMDEIECPFRGGDVDGQYDDGGALFYWVCPLCGGENTNDLGDDVRLVRPTRSTLGDVIDRALGGPQHFVSLHCQKNHHQVCMEFYGGRSCECDCHVPGQAR